MISKNSVSTTPPAPTPSGAVHEIYSYLAARNISLREAEENPSEASLRRAGAANSFVENCLRPARPPYQAQSLPEAEAARERQHCQAVKVRLAELRARAGLHRRAA